jgi:hypothetical protein
MKKLLSTVTLFILAIAMNAQVQIQVPRAVTQAFKDMNPTHDYIEWSMEGVNFKATSIDPQNLHHITVFDPNGVLVRSEVEVAANDVPVSIRTYFDDRKAVSNSYTVWKVVTKDGASTFYSTLNNQTIRFDMDGKEIQ